MKVTIKLKTNSTEQQAEMLMKATASAFPGADIDVIMSDDPCMSVSVRDSAKPSINACSFSSQKVFAELNPHARPDGGNYGRD